MVNFTGNCNFEDSLFNKTAHFSNSVFDKTANFKSIKFYGDAHFDTSKFSGMANFEDARFSEYAFFNDVNFTEGSSVCLNRTRYNKFYIEWEDIKDDKLVFENEAYLKLIKNYRELGMFEDANKCYSLVIG